MEAENMEKLLNDLLRKFSTAEKKKLEQTKKYKDWINQITSDDFHLVDTLIKCILNENIEDNLKEGIFKIFRKLTIIEESKEKMKSEIKNNKDFPKAIINFIVSREKDQLTEDPLIVLIETYTAADLAEYYTSEFISVLFSSFELIKSEEETIYGLILFLVDIANSSKQEDVDLFLNCHKSASIQEFMFFNETLLAFITKFSKEKKIDNFTKVINCVTLIMDNEEKEILYRNDIETFFISIQEELQFFNDIKYKVGYMQFLLRICKLDLFKNMYLKTTDSSKIDSVNSLKEFLQDENMPDELKGLCIKLLDELK